MCIFKTFVHGLFQVFLKLLFARPLSLYLSQTSLNVNMILAKLLFKVFLNSS